MSKSISIIGCGIAGPVLAMLLKHKGFLPTIYERQPGVQQAGISLGLSPQTFKVLHILGLADACISLGSPLEEIVSYSQVRQEVIGKLDAPGRLREWLGWPLLMISRSAYSQFLYTTARERGIEVHFRKRLVDVLQEEEGVRAVFDDGTEAVSDLLVGCDGLHSTVRSVLFGAEEPAYLGLVQIGGFSPIPDIFRDWKGGKTYQVFGDGAHFLCTRVTDTQLAWATTVPEAEEAKEDWRRVSMTDPSGQALVQGLACADWENGPREVVASATFVTKYGLYDRPVGDTWHKGRVVLLGDAAHPTSPHMGQGANQAMEDIYHLVRLLVLAQPLTSASLSAAFTSYESLRAPIVARSVAQAKKEGQNRVLVGREQCEKRDENMMLRGKGQDPETVRLRMELFQGPFMGESEV
ncbi:FAD/NAD(P)-binding domain-containing protein [Calocera viscosa TUFC12733]|uniref:FAD/NAD(P)-binding domain-containing protein n=1 Tax=Calocera viscosa (strain TUFC12733) TaxID=1330018 RepID=A0A167JW12_CALVF|nr:FAD/NAD(P)-binding domain-containing protein [Calocera viscosa TUFC12733]